MEIFKEYSFKVSLNLCQKVLAEVCGHRVKKKVVEHGLERCLERLSTIGAAKHGRGEMLRIKAVFPDEPSGMYSVEVDMACAVVAGSLCVMHEESALYRTLFESICAAIESAAKGGQSGFAA